MKIAQLIVTALMLIIGQAALVSHANAEDRWVTDGFPLPLRSGEGNNYRVIVFLKPGAKLELVAEKPDSEWVEVRTRSGLTGFMQNHHLLNVPTAALRLSDAETQLREIQQRHEALRQQLQSSETEGNTLQQTLQVNQQELEKLRSEYDELQQISASAVTLHDRHRELLHNHELLKTELDVLKAKNARLQNDSRNTFFLYGAGSVLLGVIIAIVVPHLRKRKRFSEWAN